MALVQRAIEAVLKSEFPLKQKRKAARLFLLPSSIHQDRDSSDDDATGISPSLKKAMVRARKLVEDTGKIVECSSSIDESLMRDAAMAHSPQINNGSEGGGRRILIASNLYNAADILPNMILQVASLALALPHGAVSISIYESGSTDSTVLWLHFLKLILCTLEIPYHIAAGGSMFRPRDDLTERKVERIAFLASIRNKALEPLLSLPDLLNWPQSQKSPDKSSKVVFLNDVLFCHQSLLKLVMLDQDLACGIDLSNESPFKPKDRSQLLWFYDSWVSRDRLGGMINSSFPSMDDPVSTKRAKAGLPFPAYCCFNGMAAISLVPLFVDKLRFRSYMNGECRASECSLLCDDLHRLGYHKIAIDPTVRVVYRSSHIDLAFGQQRSFDPLMYVNKCTWDQFKAAGPIHTSDRAIKMSRVLCCNKNVDSDRIVWANCEPIDPMATNYTNNYYILQSTAR